MSDRSRMFRSMLLEVAKVLIIFVAFFVLQTQIMEVRYDVYGRTSGLALAQAQTSDELGGTKKYVQLAMEDSALRLQRAKDQIEKSISHLQRERVQIREMIQRRATELESDLRVLIDEETELLESISLVAEANSHHIESLKGNFYKNADLMKRKMLLPTIQLRGHSTVGSGVLIYSEPQVGVSDAPHHTTFAITAAHVVHEVIGGELRKGLTVDDVRVFHEQDSGIESYSARLVTFDSDLDLALIRLNSSKPFHHLAQLSSRAELDALDVFSPAYAVGCPLGNRPMPTLGEISSKRKVVGDQVFWMLNAPTFFGNSGGGVYQAPTFRLIGVSSMIYTYGKRNPTVVPHMGLFVPLAVIFDWLDRQKLSFACRSQPIPREFREELIYSPPGGRAGGKVLPASHVVTEAADDTPEIPEK